MKKLLALNRGEIAIRILRAANELKLAPLRLFSQEDHLSLIGSKRRSLFDWGGQGPRQAYLDVERHRGSGQGKRRGRHSPGYGFPFGKSGAPRACKQAGITFIGRALNCSICWGQNGGAKLATEGWIACGAGTPEPVTEKDDAASIGRKNWLSANGESGVRWRRARDARCVERESLEASLQEARAEAGASLAMTAVFSSGFIRLRDISSSILADQAGNVLHLHERDCSVQRRNQKSCGSRAAVNLDPKIAKDCANAAVALAA